MWDISDSVFDKEKDDTVIENVISAPEEQFYELLDYQYYIKQRVPFFNLSYKLLFEVTIDINFDNPQNTIPLNGDRRRYIKSDKLWKIKGIKYCR